MAAASGLTARETDLLHAVANFVTISAKDWDEIAKSADMKTGKYARDTWAGVKKKLAAGPTTTGAKRADVAEPGPTSHSASKAKPTSTPRKRKDANDADDEETPSKKSKATPKKNTNKKTEAKEDTPFKSEPNDAGDIMDDLLAQGHRDYNE